MEEDKVKPNSQPPCPLPGCLEDQALSGQWLGAGGSSGLPLSDAEEEGAFAYMDQEWEYDTDQELSHSNVGSYRELSDWEESMGQELSEKEESIGQDVSRGNGKRPSVQSSWESGSDQDLAQGIWEQGIWANRFLMREEDEWDELSVLELCEQTYRERRLAVLSGDGLPVPVPREAWVEHEASEPCPRGPLRASPPCLEAPAPMGHTASPCIEEQVPEAGTQSPPPAPCRRLSPPVSHLGALTLSQQLPPRKKRHSILRRALRSLFCCCRAPEPED